MITVSRGSSVSRTTMSAATRSMRNCRFDRGVQLQRDFRPRGKSDCLKFYFLKNTDEP